MFELRNENMSLVYNLTEAGNKQVKGLYNADGKAYFNDTMNVYVVNSAGYEFSSAHSLSNGRMNSNRIGYYYYDFRFCDQVFINPNAVKIEEEISDYYDILAKSGKWNGNDVTKITNKNGVLSFVVTNANDPYVHCTTNFKTADYDTIQITIKSETSTSGMFYIAAGSHDWFNAEQHVGFKFTSGDWVTVVVPISVVSDYTGSVKGFRIDVGDTDETIQVKEIKAMKLS